MSDLDRRSNDLDERLEVVAKGSVLKTRTAFVFFLVLAVLMLAVLGAVLRVTADTNQVVRDEVVVLEERNTELEGQVSDLEDVNQQAVDEVVRLATLLQENGIDPGVIRIEPED